MDAGQSLFMATSLAVERLLDTQEVGGSSLAARPLPLFVQARSAVISRKKHLMKKMARNIAWFFPHDLRHFCYRKLRSAKYRRLRAATRPAQHNCLFIHIPKCAGVAVSHGLFGERTSWHATILDYMLLFPEEDFNRFFKFTFVRNPWDRLVSAYVFLQQGGVNDSDRLWSERYLSQFEDFDHFVTAWVNKKNIENSLHFKPQVQFLCGPRSLRPLVDFVGYYENLPNDFATIAARLGISARLAKVNMTANKRDDYKSYYTDTTTKIVSEAYRDDIAAFGYNFDNSALDLALRRRKAVSAAGPAA